MLVSSNEAKYSGMAVRLVGSALFPLSRRVEPWRVGGIGRDADGRLVLAKKMPGRNSTIVFAYGDDDSAGILRRLDLDAGEEFLRFLPSARDTFLTTHRLGTLRQTGDDVLLQRKLPAGESYQADKSGEWILISPDAGQVADVLWINCLSGAIRPGLAAGLESHWPLPERLSSILGDRSKPGSFYISLGAIRSSGRLLWLDADGRVESVFARSENGVSCLTGVPGCEKWNTSQDGPVLALAYGDKGLFWLTANSIYGPWDGVGAVVGREPAFADSGGFYTSQQCGCVAALSHVIDDRQPLYAARVSHVLLGCE